MTDKTRQIALNACRTALDQHMFEVNDMVTRENVASLVRQQLELHKGSGDILDYTVNLYEMADPTKIFFAVDVVEPTGLVRNFRGEMP